MPRRETSKRILVCIPGDLLKKIQVIQKKYRNRSELIRDALELLIVSHKKKSIERELKEGFKMLKNMGKDFAEKSLYFSKEEFED